MEFDPKDPDPNIGKVFVYVIAAIAAVGVIMAHIPQPALLWVRDEIGAGYIGYARPAIVMSYDVARLTLQVLVHTP